MIVLIDAGNTNVKLALVNINDEIERITVDEFKTLSSSITKVIYGSVKKSPVLETILIHCHSNNIHCQEISVSKTFKQIECGYDAFENLGIDRWLALIAARNLYPESDLIVVDAGTAITIDVCKGMKHLGGWIAPGLKLMQDSIIKKAPGVFTDSSIIDETFGTNTPSALLHGCIYSLVGMIKQAELLMEKAGETNTVPAKVILTGGDASFISQYLLANTQINEDLVFFGLKQFI